jgi:hypothetical protein
MVGFRRVRNPTGDIWEVPEWNRSNWSIYGKSGIHQKGQNPEGDHHGPRAAWSPPLAGLRGRSSIGTLVPSLTLLEKPYSRDVTGNEKRKIVINNRYRWRTQKNSSPICPELVSATPNDDVQNKNASLEVRLVVVLGSRKRPWQRPICTHHGFSV